MLKRFSFCVTAVLSVVFIVSGVAGAVEIRGEMVPMRDGTKLASEIYLPTGEGPWPAIMIRTPYGRRGMAGPAAAAIQHGYACVVQDFRGRFDSEGLDYPLFLHGGWGENQDGYDTVEWIAKQKWCNGKVGAFGISASGIALNMMSPSRPPHLVCMYVSVAFSDMYHQSAYQGGAFRKALNENWLNGNRFHPRSLEMIRENPNYGECDEQANLMELGTEILGGSAYTDKVYASSNSGAGNCLDLENKTEGGVKKWLILDFDTGGGYNWNAFEGCCVAGGSWYAVWPKEKATDDYDMLKNEIAPQQYWVKTYSDIPPGNPGWGVQTIYAEEPLP